MGDTDDGMNGVDWSFFGADPASPQPPDGIIPLTVTQTPSIIPVSPPQDQSAALVPFSAYAPAPVLTDPNTATFDDSTRAQAAKDALNAELSQRGIAGKTYSDLHAALSDWADAAQPTQAQYSTEVNSSIYVVPGGWQIGPAESNGSLCGDGVRCGTNLPPSPPDNWWGYIHTHPTDQALDKSDEDATSGAAFVSLPDGRIYGWNSGMGSIYDENQNFADPIYQYLVRPARGPYGY